MYFKFNKTNDDIKVLIFDGEKDLDFDYIKMINLLYNKGIIDPSVFEGQFLQEEIDRINSIVKEITDKIIIKEES